MTSHYGPEAEPTIWRIPDDLWEECRPLLPPEKAAGTPGRPALPFGQVLDGILSVLRTGCPWQAVPSEFGAGATGRRRFQEWGAREFFARVWAEQRQHYAAAGGSGGDGHSADSALVPSPLGGDATGPDPTNRGKGGTKRPVLSDRRGAPGGVALSGATRNDRKVAEETVDSGVVARPTPTPAEPPHVCRDKGCAFPQTRQAAAERGYIVHTPLKDVDTPPPPPAQRFPARRGVVERTTSWHNRFRTLRIRFEKKAANYRGLLHFACCLIVYRLRRILG